MKLRHSIEKMSDQSCSVLHSCCGNLRAGNTRGVQTHSDVHGVEKYSNKPVANGEGNASLVQFTERSQNPRNFGSSSDQSNSRTLVCGHRPVFSFDKIFSTIDLLERLEARRCCQKICRSMSTSFSKIDERAFCMPSQKCGRCRSRERF